MCLVGAFEDGQKSDPKRDAKVMPESELFIL
jgi:hypothetical protein